MSTSERANRFAPWLAGEYRRRGDFTVLVILVSIEGARIELLRSTFMNVIGDEMRWAEIRDLFAGAGVDWNGAAFFPAGNALAGMLPNETARSELRALEARLREDRRILNEGHFFDGKGRRLQVEETSLH